MRNCEKTRLHPDAAVVLDIIAGLPGYKLLGQFERRGRTDHVVFLRESEREAAWIKQTFPDAAALRKQAKKDKVLVEPGVVWENIDAYRYVRLRLSPARVTRPAAHLLQLPIKRHWGRAKEEDFANWLEDWQITGTAHCAKWRQILYGAFALGLMTKNWREKAGPKSPCPRMALDQNQFVGKRCHLICETQRPVSPAALHILTFSSADWPPFDFVEVPVATQFKARSNRPDHHLIATAPHDKIRFYLNEELIKKELELPDEVIESLTQSNLLDAVLQADACLREYFKQIS